MTQKKQTIPFLSFRAGDGLGAPEAGTAIFRYNSSLNRVEFSLNGGPYQGFANDYGGSLYGELISAPIKNPILEGYFAYVDSTSTELNRVKVESLLDLLAVSTASLQNAYDVGGEIITSSESGRFAISGTEEISLASSNNIEILSVGPLILGAGGHQVSWPMDPGAAGTVLVNNGEGDLSWAAPPGGSVSSVGLSGGTTGLTVSGTNPITTSGTFTLGGTLGVANGGTGANSLTGYVKGNGTAAFSASSSIPGSDISGNIAGSAANVTGIVAIGNGGTGQITKAAAFGALSPLSTKGDLLAFSTTNDRLPVGSAGQVLVADPLASIGIKWADAATGTISGIGSATRIAFWDSSSSISSSASLYWDNTGTGKLGIGTASPSASLEVVSATSDDGARVTGSGSNTTPTYYLRTPNSGYGRMIWENAAGTDQWVYYAGTDGSGAQTSWALNDAVASKDRLTIWGGTNLALGMIVNTSNADYDFTIKGTTDSSLFVVDANENRIGIGTALPASKFSVGASSQFQVSSAGDIVAIRGQTTTFPAANAAGVLTNNGSGTLSWSPAATGTVTGSGAATRIAFWDGASSLSSSTNLYWDNTGTGKLGIGTASPTNKTDIVAGILAVGQSALKTTGTLSAPSGGSYEIANYFVATPQGSTDGFIATQYAALATGYTGAGRTSAVVYDNVCESTGVDAFKPLSGSLKANFGVFGNVATTTGTTPTGTGVRVGTLGYSGGSSSLNVGVEGLSLGNAGKAVGVYGGAVRSAGTSNSIGGYFSLYTDSVPFSASLVNIDAALVADNGPQAATVFVARDNGTAVFTVADGGDTSISPVSGHLDNALTINGGTLSTLKNALDVSATLANPGSTFEAGAEFQIVSNGSSNSLQFGVLTQISGNYSGSGQTTALSFRNDLAGTGTLLFNDGLGMRPDGNRGIVGHTVSTTSGNNSAVVATAGSGNRNFGGYFSANIDKASALNVGVYGAARNVASGATEIGGMFHLYSSTSFPVFVSAALLADNGPSTSPIFVGRDEGSEVFRIADGGNVGIGTPSPGTKLDVVGSTGIRFRTTSSSAGFDIFDRPSVPGDQLVFQGNTGNYTLFNVATKDATAGAQRSSAIALWPVDIANAGNATQFQVQNSPTHGGVIFTQKFGTGTEKKISLQSEWQQGSTPTQLVLDINGNVGIGTSSPSATLSVSETFRVNGSTGQIVEYGNAAPTKGNLLVGDGTSLVSVGVGSNGQVLLADNSQVSGVRWGAATGVSSNSAPIQTKTSNYTMTSLDGTILADASSGSITITLPAVASSSDLVFTIKKKDITANTVTVDANASELIDGATTYVLSTQYEAIKIQSDGTAWWII